MAKNPTVNRFHCCGHPTHQTLDGRICFTCGWTRLDKLDFDVVLKEEYRPMDDSVVADSITALLEITH